jgi:dihydrofolate reductase
MAKLLYSVTMSLDGFIAGPGGDMQWLRPYLGPNPAVDELLPQIGALLVGRRTYDGDDPHKGTDKEGAFEGAWNGPQVVLTHRPPEAPVPGVVFATDLGSAVATARSAAGERYVNIIGADVAGQCLDAGLVDEVFVCVAPVLLGNGVRMFDRAGGRTIGLELVRVTEAPMAATLRLRVAR